VKHGSDGVTTAQADDKGLTNYEAWVSTVWGKTVHRSLSYGY